MDYRRNADEDLRSLERRYQKTDTLEDFLRYRRALARSGHRDVLSHRAGMFTLPVSGGGSVEYIKKAGPIQVTLVLSHEFWTGYYHIPEGEVKETLSIAEIKKRRGRQSRLDSPVLRSWQIVIPPELFEHINHLQYNFYQQQISAYSQKLGKPVEEIDGMALYALTQQPQFQEKLYKLITSELENLGYYQQIPIKEVFCSQDCGRQMGLGTPARMQNRLCFYCWRTMHNLSMEWLNQQLQENQGYAPQFKRRSL